MIKTENGQIKYFDRNGKEIIEVGTDATNKHWIKTGRAIPCEYGVYPLTIEETEEVEVVD